MARVMIQDALDYCLENPEGLSAEQLLGRFPEYRDELAPLLGLATSIEELTPPAVSAVRRDAMKARLMHAAQAARPIEPTRPALVSRQSSTVRRPWYLRPVWAGAAVAALLLVFVWWSASGALPDSPFYNVKLASESVGLTFAGSVVDKARTHIGRANDRLYDLRIMQGRERLADSQPAFDNYSYNLDGATKLWEALQGQPRTDLAGLLYASSLAGKVTFQGFGGGSSALSLVLRFAVPGT